MKTFNANAIGKNMITSHHKKIVIVGNAGSGKTTLAFQLQKKLNLPLYHLDQYYWLPNWGRIGIEKFTEIHTELCRRDAWIMEGPYIKVLPRRIAHADVVIFLDIPRSTCLWRVLKRSISQYGKVIPGSPAGCKQHLFNSKFLEFLKWVWNFENRYNKVIYDLIEDPHFKKTKQIYVLHSAQEVKDFLYIFS